MKFENRYAALRVAGIVVIAVTVLTLSALFIPVRRALVREIDQRFQLEAQLIHSTITAHLEHSMELASQIPSRTQIRREMQRYVSGEISADAYQQFAEPRLADAMRAADGIVAVTRVDRSRMPLAVVGDPLHRLESLQFLPGSAAIAGSVAHTDSVSAYVVTAPIRDPIGRLLGFDLVGISLVPLQAQLSRATRLFDATSARLSTGDEVIARAGPGSAEAIDRDAERYAVVEYRVASQWNLTVARSRDSLYAPAETFLRQMALGVIAIAAALLVVVYRSVTALRHRVHTEELEREVSTRRVLLREVHHRIKNDLSIVGSLLSLQQRTSTEPAVRAALSEAEHRVAIVSEIYNQLYRTEDVGQVRIREVLEAFAAQFRDVTIELHVEDLLLDRKVAVPVGIIVNELVVNAVKYGRPSSEAAKIAVEVAMDNHDALHISVRDNGPGFPSHDPAELSGFGLSMVDTLGSQFDGTVTIPKTESGGAIEVVLHQVERFSE
ncbi:MAG: sensor histidine kinase [Alkalispirochaeta sp.]